MDILPKNAQINPKNAPIFGKTGPEGPDLDKFVDLLSILSNWAYMSPVSGEKLINSETSSLAPWVLSSLLRVMGCVSKEKGTKKDPHGPVQGSVNLDFQLSDKTLKSSYCTNYSLFER